MIRSDPVTNLLITGPPGCGKSTLIIGIVESLAVTAAGFTTAEIRSSGGAREGFRISTLSGSSGILAHRDLPSGPRIGRYRVNLLDLESIGVAELERALGEPGTELLVIDEIASMELSSTRFRGAVARAVSSPMPLLASIQLRRDPFLDSLKRRADSRLYTLSRGIRAETASRVIADLRDLISG